MTSAIAPAMLDGVRRMNGTNRFITLVGLVLALGVIWAAVKFGGTPQLVTLYSGLDLREAGEMTDLLQKNGIRYELDLGGSEIRVEPAAMARARVVLAQSGLPMGGARKGDELLDGQTWGKTEQEMRLLERRALEEDDVLDQFNSLLMLADTGDPRLGEAIALLKARLILVHFMEAKRAARPIRLAFEAWFWGSTVAVLALQ